jgi:hypothetical protein
MAVRQILDSSNSGHNSQTLKKKIQIKLPLSVAVDTTLKKLIVPHITIVVLIVSCW